MVFLSQKVDGNMISTDYRKVLVLIFSEMGNTNTVFSWAKKLIDRWHLLVTGKVLFWTFQWWKIRSFLIQEVGGRMIFTGYGEVLVLNFSVMGNTAFFSAKKLMERWYLHSLFEFPGPGKYGFSRSGSWRGKAAVPEIGRNGENNFVEKYSQKQCRISSSQPRTWSICLKNLVYKNLVYIYVTAQNKHFLAMLWT